MKGKMKSSQTQQSCHKLHTDANCF